MRPTKTNMWEKSYIDAQSRRRIPLLYYYHEYAAWCFPCHSVTDGHAMLRDAGILTLRMMVILFLKNVYLLAFSDIPAGSLRLGEVAWKTHRLLERLYWRGIPRPYLVLPTSKLMSTVYTGIGCHNRYCTLLNSTHPALKRNLYPMRRQHL